MGSGEAFGVGGDAAVAIDAERGMNGRVRLKTAVRLGGVQRLRQRLRSRLGVDVGAKRTKHRTKVTSPRKGEHQ